MMEKYKFALALLLILFTAGWALFSVNITIVAIDKLRVSDVIVAAGANGLLGSLVTLLTLVYQHYFRKSRPE
jgi:hypothetical protein